MSLSDLQYLAVTALGVAHGFCLFSAESNEIACAAMPSLCNKLYQRCFDVSSVQLRSRHPITPYTLPEDERVKLLLALQTVVTHRSFSS